MREENKIQRKQIGQVGKVRGKTKSLGEIEATKRGAKLCGKGSEIFFRFLVEARHQWRSRRSLLKDSRQMKWNMDEMEGPRQLEQGRKRTLWRNISLRSGVHSSLLVNKSKSELSSLLSLSFPILSLFLFHYFVLYFFTDCELSTVTCIVELIASI